MQSLVGWGDAYNYLKENEGVHTCEDLVIAGMSRNQATNALRRCAKLDDIKVTVVMRRGKPCHGYYYEC